MCDAAWLCQMGECGLLKASFVPPEPIRQLRDLTRYRKLCRYRHNLRYADHRIMPSGRANVLVYGVTAAGWSA